MNKDSKKVILIIGAGREQVPAYLLAKKMGLEIVCTDIDQNAPGFKLADHSIIVSTRDVEKTFEKVKTFCKSKKINGVFTIANDVPLTVSKIANYYSLPGLPVEASKLLSNKVRMKEKFLNAKVKTPPFRKVKVVSDIKRFAENHDFPFVLKPVDGRGSKGVVLIRSFGEAEKLFSVSLSESKKDYLICEKYIEGPQLSVESVFINKVYYPIAFSDRNYDLEEISHPFFFEDGGDMPSFICDKQKEKVNNLVKSACNSLGIHWGTVKADIVIKDDEPQIIELAGRLSGGDLSTFQIPQVYNVDLVGILIRLCLGMQVKIEEVKKDASRAMSSRYIYSVIKGKIKQFEFPTGLSKNVYMTKFLDEGDEIMAINSSVQGTRAGVVRVSSQSVAEAKEIARSVVKNTKFLVTN